MKYIDPYQCSCTGCIQGVSVPLERATPKQISDMVGEESLDRTNASFHICVTAQWSAGYGLWDRKVVMTYTHADPYDQVSWDVTDTPLGMNQ